jgi:hypothetical protein
VPLKIGKYSFPEPTSIQEAQARLAAVAVERKELQTQLGNRNRTDPSGRRLSSQEYWTWRQKAAAALAAKEAEQAVLKLWLEQHSVEGTRVPLDAVMTQSQDAVSLLRDALALLESLQEAGVGFKPEEDALVSRIGTYLLACDRVSTPS